MASGGDGSLDELIIVEKIKPATAFHKMNPDDIPEIKLAIRSTLKRVVLTVFHLNADLWTIKGSHQIG